MPIDYYVAAEGVELFPVLRGAEILRQEIKTVALPPGQLNWRAPSPFGKRGG